MNALLSFEFILYKHTLFKLNIHTIYERMRTNYQMYTIYIHIVYSYFIYICMLYYTQYTVVGTRIPVKGGQLTLC